MKASTLEEAYEQEYKHREEYWENIQKATLPKETGKPDPYASAVYPPVVPGWSTKYDSISNPSHYVEGRKYEPIDVIEDWDLNFRLGNALKYIARAGRKGTKEQDLAKAVWYLQREIGRK